MAIEYNNIQRQTTIYNQMSTTNKSFLDMHYYLKDIGIENNKFMLRLYDSDLHSVDPHDPNLSLMMKQKVVRECTINYWYFIRECVRVPDSGGTVGGGKKYQLNRGNMALSFCMLNNINTMLEMPRQIGKTVGVAVWYLYLYNFGTTNSVMALLNKRLDDSKNNLQLIRDLRDALPEYLRMNKFYDMNGKEVKKPNRVETMTHPINNNKIITFPQARNAVAASNLLRGRTISNIWYDEYGFIPYNKIIYTNSAPAFNTAARNAKINGSHYGILITTTPGILTTDEGLAAYKLKENATAFSEQWYNFSYKELRDKLDCNMNSDFVYIRYTYQQLGKDEAWFKETCRLMQLEWTDIRREILLEWSEASDNCPFSKDDLEIIRSLVHAPKQKLPVLGGKYEINIYETIDLMRNPPIIGVDVSGGYNRDSSAITIIDSKTTKVIADFNCNYVPIDDLARIIYELVTRYMPNAVVNVERNGGFGGSVLQYLMATDIKRNLYYEIKDTVLEETIGIGGRMQRTTKKVKKYGTDSTSRTRDLVIEILRNRVANHKDKFISPKIFDEMLHMEIKKNGRVEHSANTHDDQVFSYLWALYVWYEGKDLVDNWGIAKASIKTDAELDEDVVTIEQKYRPIIDEILSESNNEVAKQLAQLNSTKVMTMQQWMQEEANKNAEATRLLMNDPIGRQGLANTFHMSFDDDNSMNVLTQLPSSIFGEEDINVSNNFNLRNFSHLDSR